MSKNKTLTVVRGQAPSTFTRIMGRPVRNAGELITAINDIASEVLEERIAGLMMAFGEDDGKALHIDMREHRPLTGVGRVTALRLPYGDGALTFIADCEDDEGNVASVPSTNLPAMNILVICRHLEDRLGLRKKKRFTRDITRSRDPRTAEDAENLRTLLVESGLFMENDEELLDMFGVDRSDECDDARDDDAMDGFCVPVTRPERPS